MDEEWFVLFCPDDDSHTLVNEANVIYDEDNVKLGDTVNFIYSKKMYAGSIAAFGCDHDQMKQKQEELNSKKPKRDSSFHADRPRRAALTCKSRMSRTNKSSNSASSVKAQGSVKDTTSTSASTSASTSTQPTAVASAIASKQLTAQAPTSSSQQPTHQATSKEKTRVRQQGQSAHFEGQLKGKVSKSDAANKKSVLKRLLDDPIYSSSESEKSDNEMDKECHKEQQSFKSLQNSSVTDQDDSSDSGESLTEEEIKALKKLSKKNKSLDFKSLWSLSGNSKEIPNATGNKNDATVVVGPSSCCTSKTVHNKRVRPEINNSTHAHSEGRSVTPDNEGSSTFLEKNDDVELGPESTEANYFSSPTVPTGLKNLELKGASSYTPVHRFSKGFQGYRPLKRRFAFKSLEFKGQYFLHKAGDSNVVELVLGSGVYVLEDHLKWSKRKCTTPTALARALVRFVFTEKAMSVCSLCGRPSTGKGKAHVELRPALHAVGVNAILDYVQYRAAKKGWPEPSDSFIKQAMSNVLCKERNLLKMTQQLLPENNDNDNDKLQPKI